MSKIEEASPPVLEVMPERPGHYQLIRITRTLIETLEVAVVPDTCHLCLKDTPMPDARGMRFLLDHAEGNRLVWPKEADVQPERAQYPVTGWKRLDDKLVCAECYEEFRKFVNAKRKNIHGRSTEK